jgi:hypothetical protein
MLGAAALDENIPRTYTDDPLPEMIHGHAAHAGNRDQFDSAVLFSPVLWRLNREISIACA